MSEPDYHVLEISDTESDFNGSPNLAAIRDTSVISDTPQDIDSPGASSLVLDLTADEYNFVHDISDDESNTGKKSLNKAGASVHNSISLDDDAYAFFVEAGLDNPEELSMLGINIDEIKAQREIAEKLDMDNKRNFEFALQLQMELGDAGSNNAATSSSTSSSSSNARLQETLKLKPEPSFMSQTSLKRELDAIEQQRQQSKKIKLDESGKDKAPYEIIDDDDCIDLTDESAVLQRDPYYLIDSGDEDDSDSDIMFEDYLSNPNYDRLSRPYFYGPSNGATSSNSYNRSDSLYSIMTGVPRPFADVHMPQMQGTTSSSSTAYSRIQALQSHMAAIAAQQNYKRNLPGPYSAPLTQQETERELRELLENIVSDEPPPPEDRTGTPDGLSITLLEHQKIGLQWMIKMENSNNKGGILADDMGLGKVSIAFYLI
jgi:SNF2 family DNA or RNA helicase